MHWKANSSLRALKEALLLLLDKSITFKVRSNSSLLNLNGRYFYQRTLTYDCKIICFGYTYNCGSRLLFFFFFSWATLPTSCLMIYLTVIRHGQDDSKENVCNLLHSAGSQLDSWHPRRMSHSVALCRTSSTIRVARGLKPLASFPSTCINHECSVSAQHFSCFAWCGKKNANITKF